MAANPQLFAYRAVDSAGVLRTGELRSISRAAALDTLARDGLIPVDLNEGHTEGPTVGEGVLARLSAPRRASRRDLLVLTESLAALLKAGLTIDRALQIHATLATTALARGICERLLAAVRSGQPLHAAFGASEQHLPPYYTSMIEAGEVGGSLPDTLARLAELIRRQLETRERIRSALIYPALLSAVVLLTLVMLLAFVLPRFELLFAGSEAPLPLSTRAVLAAGRVVADYWWALAALGLGLSVGLATMLRSGPGRLRFDRWLLTSRLVFGVPGALDSARFLRTLSTLCRNGMPLPAALRVARGTIGNRALLVALDSVIALVQGGEPFSTALTRVAAFPRVAPQLARVGEETGHLDEMLLSAAAVLEEESQRQLERLLTLIAPLLTVAMGLVVAGLIGSVLIGLLSINDLAF